MPLLLRWCSAAATRVARTGGSAATSETPTWRCTGSAGRTASRRGRRTGHWPAACTALFSAVRDASKVALVHLVGLLRADPRPHRLLDVQWATPHMQSLGARAIPRE